MSKRIWSMRSPEGDSLSITITRGLPSWLRPRAARLRLAVPWRYLRRVAWKRFATLFCLFVLEPGQAARQRLATLALQWLRAFRRLGGTADLAPHQDLAARSVSKGQHGNPKRKRGRSRKPEA